MCSANCTLTHTRRLLFNYVFLLCMHSFLISLVGSSIASHLTSLPVRTDMAIGCWLHITAAQWAKVRALSNHPRVSLCACINRAFFFFCSIHLLDVASAAVLPTITRMYNLQRKIVCEDVKPENLCIIMSQQQHISTRGSSTRSFWIGCMVSQTTLMQSS